jgi:hypothetical protein
MNKTTGRPKPPKFTKRQLEDAIISLYEDVTRFGIKPILNGKTAEQARKEDMHDLTRIEAVLDYHQVHEQFRQSFDVIHPEVKIMARTIHFVSNGVPVLIRLIDDSLSINKKFRNPDVGFLATGEVYLPN